MRSIFSVLRFTRGAGRFVYLSDAPFGLAPDFEVPIPRALPRMVDGTVTFSMISALEAWGCPLEDVETKPAKCCGGLSDCCGLWRMQTECGLA